MTRKQLENLWFGLAVVSLLAGLVLLLARPVFLPTADLGRHLKNGELILEGLKKGSGWASVLYTNTYSYTHPEFPSVNHHWGSGVIFYVLQSSVGFLGLHWFYILLMSGTLIFAFFTAQRRAGTWCTWLVVVALLPLLAYRWEVRPEAFSYLFLAFFVYWLVGHKESGWSKLWWLLPLQVLWANTHIYFFLGFAVVGCFVAEAVLQKAWTRVRRLFLLGTTLVLASLVTPFGWAGLAYPFTIFTNYGYRVLENQTPWFLQNLSVGRPEFWLLEMVAGLVACVLVYSVWHYRKMSYWSLVFLAVLGAGLGLFAVRNSVVCFLLVLPVLAAAFQTVLDYPKLWWSRVWQIRLSASLVLAAVFFVWALPAWRGNEFGLGLSKAGSRAGEFIRQTGIRGPIFNNYDSGGYLIHELYPDVPVFVDNRPESYPAEFFREVYVPMQESSEEWRKQDRVYQFNAVVVYWHDATPWAQSFFAQMLQDKSWAPVYADSSMLIWLRRRRANEQIIKQYELPRSMFGVR